jgi:hypothetical protein
MIQATETSAGNGLTSAGLMHPSENRGDTPRGHPLVTTIASLMSSGILPAQIDLMKIDTGDADLEVTKGLTSVRLAVVQLEFSSEEPVKQDTDQTPFVSASEKSKAMRDLEYYWVGASRCGTIKTRT